MGCKSNGGCSSGGCNRLNVYNWLNDLPLHDGARPFPIVEVSFNNGSRKEFFRNNTNFILEKNDWITVEGVSGFDLGKVSLTGELVKLQMKKYSVSDNSITKRILHPATVEELEQCTANKEREPQILVRSRAIAKTLNLEMKLCEVEVQADGRKGTYFYTADQRVDFRELIKLFATEFRMKIEMKQIGARQESGKVGGIGSCGRELCCSTWLSDFKSVNTTAARYQNLSINQTKLSGQCGRLKCCLNYELDTYMDALSVFPHHADSLDTVKGVAHLQKRDIFKNLMWYSFSDNNKQYPLSIDRVKEILKMNKLGQKADELQPVELETKAEKAGVTVDVGFVNDVGQITLKNLEKNNKKKKPGQQAGKNQQGKPQQEQGRGPKPEAKVTGQQEQPATGEQPRKNPQQQGQPRQQQGKPQARPQQARPQGEQQPGQQQQPRPPRQPQQGNEQRPPRPVAQPGQETADGQAPQPAQGQQRQGNQQRGQQRSQPGNNQPNNNQPRPERSENRPNRNRPKPGNQDRNKPTDAPKTEGGTE
jgi:cell fate regulator YaaT (PSP1 superfamily)